MTTRVVLASASPARRAVLRAAGIDPVVLVSGVDEDAVVAALPDDTGPGEVTTALAVAKADAVLASLDTELRANGVVIGCDSMLYRDGRLWGKPPTEAAVLEGWRAMAGTSGRLYTGHCVIRLRDGVVEARVADHEVTTVRFGRPSEADLRAYARSGEPTSVAGGFTLDGLGGWFVEGVDGDPSAVIGISLPLTRRLLERTGLLISELWQGNSPD
ncbi:Maf-like protein [Mycolicibacterium madagascariense]|uniref:Nucleoside triphosphate pyrophosphatase n=1 Tax=Mycolicibacterium madagascariense TaxID=212765 RepID=A0A7I7XBL1_9MYCO|nr:nucleoside triphosphate pyrophosphatase [Mycolicibacterium madagascariense]MCV7015732.1 septum formation inhibitor Maf [Mycolicibacterium madagascariense]BBZ27149.1 Maf-like protein [Mycolicibacterium madagascariense]